jgi:anaerobic magnesium-protoporphyrin IX monomethyl ester cyclase
MKEKILVINPPRRMFPLGMAYVLSCLESHGIDFDFIDANFGNDYRKLIKKNDYYAIATGGLVSEYNFFNEVSRTVREKSPDIPLILGGGITKDLRHEFLFDKLHYTYGIIGEAETSFPFLLHALQHKKTGLEAVPGLLFKDPKTGRIHKNPSRHLDFSAADILPAWHRFNVDYYINDWEHIILGRRLCMPVISARGCTGTCTFCSNLAGAYRKRPIEQVIREIELLTGRYTFDWISFYNEMFYPTEEEIVRFCEAYTTVKRRKNWTCDMRVDADFSIDTFRLMKSAGCVVVFGGLESGSDKILSLMKKRTTKEMISRFYGRAEAAGLPCVGGFLVGNEGETQAEIRETVDMVTKEKMRALDTLVCTYPGTKIYENAKKRGLIGDEWEYLKNLDFLANIWDYSWNKKDYVNISDIPSDRFWETVVTELRRFNTFNLAHFVPGNMTYACKFGFLIKVTGQCAGCGCPVTFITGRKTLGIQTYCRDCFRTVEFNLYHLPELSGHFQQLCAELREAKKLAVIGTKAEATSLLRYDYFKLNYAALAAFVETSKKASGNSDFYHFPRIRMEGLPDLKPDTLLIVDDRFGTAELKVRQFYLKKNLLPPRILHLLPDEKRPLRRLLRLSRAHPSPTNLNKCIVFPAIQVPLLIEGMQTRLINLVRSNLQAVQRNAAVRWFVRRRLVP